MATSPLDPPPAQEAVDDGLSPALREMGFAPRGLGRLKVSLRWLKWFNDLRLAVNALIAGGGGGGSPGGSNHDVQYNNAGAFGGIPPNTVGFVLTDNGVGVTPSFQASTGGITQLTGDVTAGPGTGAQAATLGKVFYAEMWHNMYGGI